MGWLIAGALFVYLYEKGKLPRALMSQIQSFLSENPPVATSQGDYGSGASILSNTAAAPSAANATPGKCGCGSGTGATSPSPVVFPGVSIPSGERLIGPATSLNPPTPPSSFVNAASELIN